jgi:DNA polymerase I
MYSIITGVQDLNPLLTELGNSDIIGIDTETTGLDPYTNRVLLIQLNVNNKIFLIDVRKLEKRLTQYIIQLLKDSNKLVVGHNLEFDLKMIFNLTGELLTNVYDTMIAEMLMFSGLNYKFPSYKELVDKYCFIEIVKETRESFIDFTGELTNDQLNYSALDVKFLFDIRNKQIKELEKQNQIKILDLENGLVPVFSKMEYDGIWLDKEQWLTNAKLEIITADQRKVKLLDFLFDKIDYSKYKNVLEIAEILSIPVPTKKLRTELENLSVEHGSWIRDNFNINSTYQMRSILKLFEIDVSDTNENTLQKFRDRPVIQLLLEYRESEKRVSTYGEKFLSNINPVTGFIHTDWNQLISTGRISSKNPNLQNQPQAQSFRSCYKARPGYKLITADYSQAELRLIGAVSGEVEFIKAFKEEKDLHVLTASILFDKDMKDVTKDERKSGKSVNFGLNYGISAWGLFRKFDVPLEKGELWIEKYFEGYKYIAKFIKLAGEAVIKNYFSVTPYGRKRFFEKKILFRDSKEQYKYEAEIKREGVNHIIQGGIADAVKISMLNIFKNNPFTMYELRILLQVHDELVIEVLEEHVDKAIKFINKTMVDALQSFLGEIPAIVDIHVNDCWSKE